MKNEIKQRDDIKIGDDTLSAYCIEANGELVVVMALNISDACDKLDVLGIVKYGFVNHKSIPIIY